MIASDACFDLIKRFESLALSAYLCPAKIWTIGWGHTDGVHEGDKITLEQARQFLDSDVNNVQSALAKVLPRNLPITQGQWDALVSLCFNLRGGPATLPDKAPHLWEDLIYEKKSEAADEFMDMDHALVHGVSTELPGLKRRREAERALFLA